MGPRAVLLLQVEGLCVAAFNQKWCGGEDGEEMEVGKRCRVWPPDPLELGKAERRQRKSVSLHSFLANCLGRPLVDLTQ